MQEPHPRLVHAFGLLQAGRRDEALPIVRERAEARDPHALNLLAEMVWGGMLPQNPALARQMFAQAEAAGHNEAGWRATNLLASGIAGPRDWAGAIARLRGEARVDAGRARALALVAAMALTDAGDPAAAPEGERLSEAPVATLFRGLISAEECAYLLDVAAPAYAPATVYDAARRLVRDPIRTSDGSALHWLIEDPAVHALNRRLAAASGSAVEAGEAGQVLRYAGGQEYRPHLDFVRASDNQRVLTALLYLNADYAGGETVFTKAGLRVKGGTGDVLVFRNALPDRSADPMSEHAGMPVTSGTKYIYSRWIHERRWQP